MSKRTLANKTSFPKRKVLTTAAVLAVVVAIILVVLSYSGFYPPLVPKGFIFTLDNTIASIPLVPKTPKQIFTKAIFSNQTLRSYSADANVIVSGEGSDKISLSFFGRTDKAGLFGSSSIANVKGELKGSLVGLVDFQTVERDKDFFFRTTGDFVYEGFDPRLLGNQWYQLGLGELQTNLGVETKNDSEIINDVKNQFLGLLEKQLDKGLFSRSKAKTIQRDNQTYYQLQLNLPAAALNEIKVFNGYSLGDSDLALEINKKTFYLEKVSLATSLIPVVKASKDRKLSLALNYVVSGINQSQKIDIPKQNKLIKNVLDLSLAFAGKSTTNSAADLLSSTEKANDLGQNFLTFERFLRVVLLLPKAVYPN